VNFATVDCATILKKIHMYNLFVLFFKNIMVQYHDLIVIWCI